MFKIQKFLFSLIILFFLFILSFYIKDFRIDASSDSLVSQNDEDFLYYNYYQNIFPSNNSLVIAVESQDKINKKLLNEIKNISDKINVLPEVESVFSINQAPILFLNNTNLIDLSNNNYETIINTKYDIKDVLKEFSESPIYSDQIINNKQNVTSLIISLKENSKVKDIKKNKKKYLENNKYYKIKSEIDKNRNELIFKIRNIIKESDTNYNYYLGGIEMISSDVISFVKSDIIIFSILVILLVLVILFIIFRKIKWVLLSVSSSLCAVYTMIGIAGFLNYEVTAVSANFLSLMFILSISMNIHIINHYIQSNKDLKNTIKIMFWPCFYTFLTTVVAFASLLIADIKPIIDFGIIMILSLIVVLICSFTVLPLLISFFPNNEKNISNEYKIINFFFNLSFKFKKIIIFSNLILFFIAIYGISNLKVENSFIKYFKKNTEIFQGMKLIDTELGGTTPLDVVVKFKSNNNNNSKTIDEDNNEDISSEIDDDISLDNLFDDQNIKDIWFTIDKINTIKEVHRYLESKEEIGKVTSIYSLINVANLINKSELSTFELSILYDEVPDNYKTTLFDPYLSIENNMVKISSRVKDSEDIKRSELINDINLFIKKSSFENIEEYKVNGLLVLYNNMLSSLFSSQIKSLGFVLFAIFLMFIVLFRSFKLSLIGMVPNIFASSYILGIIGLLKIPLDIMTITIAAISIGIAVDNTIHYLYRYKKNMNKEKDAIKSIQLTHNTVGKAVIITSFAISLGFIVLCFSNFIPTIIFGFFTSLAMIFALIGVLITLPSIINYTK